MERRHIKWIPILVAVGSLAYYFIKSEKFVNPETGESARVGLSTEQEKQLGLQSYDQILHESNLIQSGPDLEMVRRVAQRLTRAVGEAGSSFDWRVSLVQSDEVNAFCLPGGKIVVYTGILPVAGGESGLAVVMGHEIAHAVSRHGAQRVFEQGALEIAVRGVQGSLTDLDPAQQRTILGLLGAGAQYGVALPFSRKHETEADAIGLRYMARAGYDPEEAIGFWERMEEAGGSKPPEIMSTHPSDRTRIENIRKLLPQAKKEYENSGR